MTSDVRNGYNMIATWGSLGAASLFLGGAYCAFLLWPDAGPEDAPLAAGAAFTVGFTGVGLGLILAFLTLGLRLVLLSNGGNDEADPTK